MFNHDAKTGVPLVQHPLTADEIRKLVKEHGHLEVDVIVEFNDLLHYDIDGLNELMDDAVLDLETCSGVISSPLSGLTPRLRKALAVAEKLGISLLPDEKSLTYPRFSKKSASRGFNRFSTYIALALPPTTNCSICER